VIETSFAFVYLGRRGGGNALLSYLIDNLEEEVISHRFIVSQRNESIWLYSKKSNVNIMRTNTWSALFRDSWREVRNSHDNYVFVMQHPHDIFIWGLTKIFNKSRILMVHDDKRHKGDIYPRTFGLHLRARSANQRIFFSKYVQSKYPLRKNDFVWSYYNCINRKRTIPASNYLLTIGRLRKYQGVLRIPNIISKLTIEFDRWIIAGNSKTLVQQPIDRIEQNKEWLSENEIDSYIATARVVVLPYTEASQSGILLRIANLGVPIVLTSVGGLPEQVKGLHKCVLVKGSDDSSVAQAIETAWKMKEILDSQVNESNQRDLILQLVIYLKSHER